MATTIINKTTTGISLGSCLAAVISYNVVHAFFGWFYVAYYVLTRAL